MRRWRTEVKPSLRGQGAPVLDEHESRETNAIASMSLAHPGDLGDADGHSVEVSKELWPHEIRISCTDPGLAMESRNHTQSSDANADWNEGLTVVNLLVVCEASLVEDLAKRCQHLQIRSTPGQFLNAMQESLPDGVRRVLGARVVL